MAGVTVIHDRERSLLGIAVPSSSCSCTAVASGSCIDTGRSGLNESAYHRSNTNWSLIIIIVCCVIIVVGLCVVGV